MKHAERKPDDLDRLIQDAFERMTPSAEVEERLLASLLEAQEDRRRSPLSSETYEYAGLRRSFESKAKRRRPSDPQAKHLRITAISLAACLAIAIVGIAGMIGLAGGIGFQAKMSAGSSKDLQSALSAESHSEESGETPGGDAPINATGPSNENEMASDPSEGAANQNETDVDEAEENAGDSGESSGNATSADGDVRYPHIVLDSGEKLEIVETGRAYAVATNQDIEEFIGTAIASNDLGETAICHVFTSKESSPCPYVVSYVGSSTLYFALPV